MDPDEDIQAHWTATELSVLRTAELDVPPHGSVERTLTAIGVGAALGAGAGLGGKTSPVGTAGSVGRMAHRSVWFKWLAAAAVGGGLASALLIGNHPRPSIPPTATTARPVLAPVVAETNPPAAQAPAAPQPAPVAPNTVVPVPAHVEAQDKSPKPESSADALAAEIRLIDEARARLRRGDAAGSLETLGRYDQLVKRGGSMRAEATVVRIEALQASGDGAKASALGERFLAKNPESPYADYVKRILSQTH